MPLFRILLGDVLDDPGTLYLKCTLTVVNTWCRRVEHWF